MYPSCETVLLVHGMRTEKEREITLLCSVLISSLMVRVEQSVLLAGEMVERTDVEALFSCIYIEIGKWPASACEIVLRYATGSLIFVLSRLSSFLHSEKKLAD